MDALSTGDGSDRALFECMLLEVVGPLGIPDIALGGTAVPCPPPGLFIDLLMNFSSNDIKLSVDKSLA